MRPPRSTLPSARRRRAGYLFCLPGMAFLALFLAYPLFYNLWTSVHDVRLSALLGEGGRFTGLDNYRAVTDDPGLASWVCSTGVTLWGSRPRAATGRCPAGTLGGLCWG